MSDNSSDNDDNIRTVTDEEISNNNQQDSLVDSSAENDNDETDRQSAGCDVETRDAPVQQHTVGIETLKPLL